MPILIEIILACIFLYFFPTTRIDPRLDGMQRLMEAQQKLIDNTKHHQTHDEGPFTNALFNEMKAVKTQYSDLMVELGCTDDKEYPLCVLLGIQERALTSQMVAERLKWHYYAQDLVMKGMANAGRQQGGKVVFRKAVREDAGPE